MARCGTLSQQVWILVFALCVLQYGAFREDRGRHAMEKRAEAAQYPSFASFIETHHRTYGQNTKEYQLRQQLYEERVKDAQSTNRRSGKKLWTAGVNQFSDWTSEELQQLRGWRGVASQTRGSPSDAMSRYGSGHLKAAFLQRTGKIMPLPAAASYGNLSALSNNINQGACGSCWAITASTVLNSHSELHSEQPTTFSVQELLSCVPNSKHCGGSGGCDGATVELAMDYVMNNGIASEADTPYKEVTGVCKRDSHSSDSMALNEERMQMVMQTAGVHSADSTSSKGLSLGMHAWERLAENKYEPLMRALVEHGPVGVSVAAATWAMYIDGIFDHCSPDSVIDHAVVLIGYGNDKDLDEKFWLIQNSWGSEWGESGRIRLLRRDSDEEECGNDDQPEAGTGCDGGPASVRVCGMCGILYDSVVPHFKAVTAL